MDSNKNEYSFTEKQLLYKASIKIEETEIAIQEVNENLKAGTAFGQLLGKMKTRLLNDGSNYYCYDFSKKENTFYS